MFNFTIKIPSIMVKPPAKFVNELQQTGLSLANKYKAQFVTASNAANVPLSVLFTVAFIEQRFEHYNSNGSVSVSGSERSTGILQVSPEAALVHLSKEIAASRISSLSIGMIKKYLPQFNFTLGVKPTYDSSMVDNMFSALKNVDFNILMGAIYIRRLLEDTKDLNGTMRLDKAIIKYNMGENSRATKTPAYILGDTTALYNQPQIANITKSYIVKSVGVLGCMDFYTKNGF